MESKITEKPGMQCKIRSAAWHAIDSYVSGWFIVVCKMFTLCPLNLLLLAWSSWLLHVCACNPCATAYPCIPDFINFSSIHSSPSIHLIHASLLTLLLLLLLLPHLCPCGQVRRPNKYYPNTKFWLFAKESPTIISHNYCLNMESLF